MDRTVAPRPRQQFPIRLPTHIVTSIRTPVRPPRHGRPLPRIRPPPRPNPNPIQHACQNCDCGHNHHVPVHNSGIRPPPRRMRHPQIANSNQPRQQYAWSSHAQHMHAASPSSTSFGGPPSPPKGRPPRNRSRPMSASSYFSSQNTPRAPRAPRETPRGTPGARPSFGTKSAALNEYIRSQDVSVGVCFIVTVALWSVRLIF